MDFDIMNLEVQEPVRDFNDYSWTMYGVGGIGKTSTIGHLFDDPAFFQFEQGQNTLRTKKIPVPDWKTMRQYVKTLVKANKEGKPMPFKTAVFDTDDVATKLCQEYVCTANGWASPSDGAYGAGWNAVGSEWQMTIKAIEDLGIRVVHITHDGTKEIERKDGTKYTQILPKVGNTFLGAIVDQTDFVIYCDKMLVKNADGSTDEKRMMHFRETTEYKAKSHLMHMPEHIEFGATPQETAKRLRDAFEQAVELEFGTEGVPVAKKEKKVEPIKEKVKPKVTKEVAEDGTVTDMKSKIEPKVEQKKEKPVVEEEMDYPDEEENEDVQERTLSEVVEELNVIFTDIYKSKKMTPIELVKFCKEHSGVSKVSEIKDVDKALTLLEEAKQI